DAPLDSSASAIISAALLRLAHHHPDQSQRSHWRQHAERLIAGLCSDFLARDSEHRGLLKHACYSQPHGVGTNSAAMFGDYYFIEAVLMANETTHRASVN